VSFPSFKRHDTVGIKTLAVLPLVQLKQVIDGDSASDTVFESTSTQVYQSHLEKIVK
jgi:hypothetical protein